MPAPASVILVCNEHVDVRRGAGHGARRGGVSTPQVFLNDGPTSSWKKPRQSFLPS